MSVFVLLRNAEEDVLKNVGNQIVIDFRRIGKKLYTFVLNHKTKSRKKKLKKFFGGKKRLRLKSMLLLNKQVMFKLILDV